MIDLYKDEDDKPFAQISEAQLQFLRDELEEESTTDVDYAITTMTLGLFVEDDIDPELLKILEDALGNQDEITIRWARE